MGARVLIAGCGFVGTPLAGRLAQRGCDVFALRRGDVRPPPGVRPLRADLSRIETLDCLPLDIDAVVYTAGAGAPTEAAYRSAYLDGVDRLFRVLRERGVEVERDVVGELDGDVLAHGAGAQRVRTACAGQPWWGGLGKPG